MKYRSLDDQSRALRERLAAQDAELASLSSVSAVSQIAQSFLKFVHGFHGSVSRALFAQIDLPASERYRLQGPQCRAAFNPLVLPASFDGHS